MASEVLLELDPGVRQTLIEILPQEKINALVERLDSDDAADIVAELPEPVKETYVSRGCFRFEYPAREGLAPVTLWWGDGGKYPPEEITNSIKECRGQLPNTGCLFVGQRGQIYTDGWGVAGIMKLKGDKNWRGVLDHDAVKTLPLSVPRSRWPG